MNEDFYKKHLTQQLADEARITEAATSAFFDTSKGVDERLKAIKRAASFNSPSAIAQAAKNWKDITQNTKIRAALVTVLSNEANTNEDMITGMIDIVKQENEPEELRVAAFFVLRNILSSSLVLQANMPLYKNALRNLVSANTILFKEEAMEMLAIQKDKFLQRLLIEGLKDSKKQITDPATAIHLLAYDMHAEYYPILRELANHTDPLIKISALYALAADTDNTTANLYLSVIQNRDESAEIRHTAALALEIANREKLLIETKFLLTDEKEDPKLKTMLLNTLSYMHDTKELDEDAAFQTTLQQLQQQELSTTSPDELKMMIERYRKNKNML